jgi:Fe2+ or Zn2+ uptake regulation protein
VENNGDKAERLRRAGLRVTGPRLAVLAELEQNRTHPNAWQIHRRLSGRHPSLSVSTIYLTLEAFVRAGLVRRLPAKDGRMRVDGTPPDHDHAVCRDCGAVFDVPSARPRRAAAPAGLPRGLEFLAARVEYEVLCPDCQRPRPASRRGAGRVRPGP